MTDLSSPIESVSFISVDVETTGLDPRRDEIVEIGAVKVLDGEVIGEFDTLVAIKGFVPFGAQRVNGISDDMLDGQPSISDALASLLAFVLDGTLVEHSHQAFDIAFLEHAHGSALTSTCLNTCTLSRRLFPFIRKHSLHECCRRHQIENRNTHRALSDAHATAALLACLLEACGKQYPRLGDLARVASVERQPQPSRRPA